MTPSKDERYRNTAGSPDGKPVIGVMTWVTGEDATQTQVEFALRRLERTVNRYAKKLNREVILEKVSVWFEWHLEEPENDVVSARLVPRVYLKVRDPYVETEDSSTIPFDTLAVWEEVKRLILANRREA